MSERPLVTVAIPTRNRASLLRECLASVLTQSLGDIEVFVSDNASTDDTADVIASFNDPRVHHTKLDRDIGLQGNFSRCLELGRSPYLVVLPDDDLMLPENLERKVRFLEEHSGVAFVHSAFHVVGPEGQLLRENAVWLKAQMGPVEKGIDFVRQVISESGRVNWCSVVLNSSAVASERFDPADGAALDFGLQLRLARKGDVGYIDEALVAYREHQDSYSVREGLQEIRSDRSYRARLAQVALDQRVKTRFLSSHGRELPDTRALRRASRRWAQGELLRLVAKDMFPHRSFGRTGRMVLEAARIEPSLLLQRKVLRLMLGSAIGPRGRAAVHRVSDRLSQRRNGSLCR